MSLIKFIWVGMFCIGMSSASAKVLVEQSLVLMGSVLNMKLWTLEAKRENAQRVFDDIEKELGALEQVASHYIPGSEVSSWSQLDSEVRVSDRLWPLVLKTMRFAEDYPKFFNPLLGPVSSLWGFGVSPPETIRKPRRKEIRKALRASRLDRVSLDKKRQSLSFSHVGTQFQFGASGKGYALDLAKPILRRHEISEATLDFGGQLLLYSQDALKTWKVDIRDPRRPVQKITTIEVGAGSVATSANYGQLNKNNEKAISHIINPKNGKPVTHTSSVTVWTPAAIEADILSTLLFVAGFKKGRKLLRNRTDTRVIWIPRLDKKPQGERPSWSEWP